MARYTMYQEFFQRGVREDFACPGSIVQKPSAKPGESWSFTCKSDRSRVALKVTVVGARGANRGTMIQELAST